jgi:hypothetical protein
MPWKNSVLLQNKKLTDQLHQSAENLAKTNLIRRMVLFSSDGQGTDRVAQVFSPLGSKVVVRSSVQLSQELRATKKQMME